MNKTFERNDPRIKSNVLVQPGRGSIPGPSRQPAQPPLQLARLLCSVVRCECRVRVRGPYTRGQRTGRAAAAHSSPLSSPSRFLPPRQNGGVKRGNQKSRVCSVPFPGSRPPPPERPPPCRPPPSLSTSSRSSSPTRGGGGSLGESASGGGGGCPPAAPRSHFEN